MNPFTLFIKRYPQVVFWGIAWSASFLGFSMRSRTQSDLWFFVALYGTFLGGALITAIADGRVGLKTYFSRIVRWRVGIKWYIIALLIPLILRLVAFGLNIATGAEINKNPLLPSWSDAVIGYLLTFFIIGVGEEPSFRGFVLPRLLAKHSSLTASLILGVLHAIWHIPLFLSGDDAAISTTLIVIGSAVLYTWLFNRTNGSVLLAMFMHTSIDLWPDVFNPFFSAAGAYSMNNWLAAAFLVSAILVIILTGKELGRKPEVAMKPKAADQPMVAD